MTLGADQEAEEEGEGVRPGLEVLLSDFRALVVGRRVGLITNHTGVDRSGRSGIDLLHADADIALVALYAPEHGIRGTLLAGEPVAGGRDEATGVPIHSLYGAHRAPTPAMLAGVEVLLFDVQDVGARCYTYVSTMALAMQAAGQAGIPFVVLDRPNPIGGTLVQGNVLDPAFSSFVGMYPIPMRHGMTPGELARLFQRTSGLSVTLQVVPAAGLRRDLAFSETGLPWVPPSPSLPSVESALHYPGSVLFEGTNLSVGRGTDLAFQVTAAPWLDGEALAAALAAWPLPGVRFAPIRLTPHRPGDQKFDGEAVSGIQWIATDPGQYDPTLAAIAVLWETRRQSGARWAWRPSHFDRLAGTDTLRQALERLQGAGAGEPPQILQAIAGPWAAQRAAFHADREAALLSAYDSREGEAGLPK